MDWEGQMLTPAVRSIIGHKSLGPAVGSVARRALAEVAAVGVGAVRMISADVGGILTFVII